MGQRPWLMIPGPVEISPGVEEAGAQRPPSHTSPELIEAFGEALRGVRAVWRASADSQPFVVAGSGTLAMETAVVNVVDPGQEVVVVNTGYFSDRMADMLRRRGAVVREVTAELGEVPSAGQVREAMTDATRALFATHVDTSTGVRVDARGLCELARERDALAVFDGVCATAGERLDMEAWGADVYLTGSQKALSLPPGLALWVASPRALAAREALTVAPPMSLDWHAWRPIMQAYEEGRPSYFATPATTLVLALRAGLREILGRADDVDAAVEAQLAAHQRAADAMRAAWSTLELELVPRRVELAANTLSAVRYPEGVGAELVGEVFGEGAVIAGGLHPRLKTKYFRVGHMGWTVDQPEVLVGTARAIATALAKLGRPDRVGEVEAAVRAALG